MRKNQQLVVGIFFAVLLIVFVMVAGLTAMAENSPPRADQPVLTQTPIPEIIATSVENTDGGANLQTTAALANTLSASSSKSTETITPTFTPIAGGCAFPSGWAPVVIAVGDTLSQLAQTYRTSIEVLMDGNCLLSEGVQPGSLLYVPSSGISSPTLSISPTQSTGSTAIACGAPAAWKTYRVKKGDTLFSLAHAYDTSVTELQFGNCLGSSTQILAGSDIKVPNIAKTNTPLAPSITPTFTNTAVPPTATATIIASKTPTSTAVPTATAVVTATETATTVATATVTETPTPTETATATPTFTPTP